MSLFLETDIREEKKCKKRIQTSVDNTVNDMRYEINLKIVSKTKITFFIKRNIVFFFKQKYILYLETYFSKISKNLIA